MSTKEMGPGSRCDLLDDIFGDYNWRKVCNQGGLVQEWTKIVEAWEADPKNAPNRLTVTQPTISQAAVHLQLAEEDAELLKRGLRMNIHHEVSPSMMIMAGLELQEQQHHLRTDIAAMTQHATDLQRVKIIEWRNALQQKIDNWMETQQLYMPGVVGLWTEDIAERGAEQEVAVQDMKLYLPSEVVGIVLVGQISCDDQLSIYEFHLRVAQAFNVLNDMCCHLRLWSQMYKLKDRFVQGQHHNTRAKTTIAGVQEKIDADVVRYRHACTSVVHLSLLLVGHCMVPPDLRVLEDKDIREMIEGEEGDTEGWRSLSWI
ncbi:hypothetical protein SCP_0300710 [Sparassis crispa]|uniref:Uncharacterized protein n=1 Tax=Sparassis crispa TaxID=139825 RepID=A0A401GDV2_9APHY|nr:hypothetical protein SCP_0300710 [Sparassis crispa]GBE80356.1 hypothetical protein SCP_0300710 [Sparassis crispa]